MAVIGNAQLGLMIKSLNVSFPNEIGLTIRMVDGSAVPQQLVQLDGRQVSSDDVKAVLGTMDSGMFKDTQFLSASEIVNAGRTFQVNVIVHHRQSPTSAEHLSAVSTLKAWVDANLA